MIFFMSAHYAVINFIRLFLYSLRPAWLLIDMHRTPPRQSQHTTSGSSPVHVWMLKREKKFAKIIRSKWIKYIFPGPWIRIWNRSEAQGSIRHNQNSLEDNFSRGLFIVFFYKTWYFVPRQKKKEKLKSSKKYGSRVTRRERWRDKSASKRYGIAALYGNGNALDFIV